MGKFEDTLAIYTSGEDAPELDIDALAAAHADDIAEQLAAVSAAEGASADLTTKLAAVKSHNYDLIRAGAASKTPAVTADSDPSEDDGPTANTITTADLFTKK